MQLLTTICPKINQKQHYIKYHNKVRNNVITVQFVKFHAESNQNTEITLHKEKTKNQATTKINQLS